jgi:hypothetical protein
MGKPEELKREAEEVRRMFGDGFNWRWREGDALRYLSGEWDKERALQEATGLSEATMHYAIGIERLAAGDREAAFLHFNQCIQTNIEAQFWGVRWAGTYVARMKRDANWPDWIEKKNAAE